MTPKPLAADAEARFDAALEGAKTVEAAFAALEALARATVGCRLFTVMLVDLAAMVARRAYSSNPIAYSTSGEKPVEMNPWFETVGGRGEIFVANTIGDIAEVFPDADLITSLGCASVVNLPVLVGGTLAGTVNLLHEAGYYTPDRVALCRAHLAGPAARTFVRAATP